MGQLDGKVAVVTGSGRGIGQQVALRLARDGAAVVVNDLDDAPAKETIALIERLGGRAVACNGDVTAKDFGERIVDTAVRQLGGLHVIVNNAGYTWDNVIQKMTDESGTRSSTSMSPPPSASSAPSRPTSGPSSRRSRHAVKES
jgi:3-oxoacyl-[acyl-carrier protein] reductase